MPDEPVLSPDLVIQKLREALVRQDERIQHLNQHQVKEVLVSYDDLAYCICACPQETAKRFDELFGRASQAWLNSPPGELPRVRRRDEDETG